MKHVKQLNVLSKQGLIKIQVAAPLTNALGYQRQTRLQRVTHAPGRAARAQPPLKQVALHGIIISESRRTLSDASALLTLTARARIVPRPRVTVLGTPAATIPTFGRAETNTDLSMSVFLFLHVIR